jgi:hypothetical protein
MSVRGLRVLAAALLCARFAQAQPAQLDRATSREGLVEHTRNWANLRMGGSTSAENGMPELCLEVSPVALVSAEACGTGSGVLHDRPGRELAHFRLELSPLAVVLGPGVFAPQVGAGIAELQLGPDRPGFRFDRDEERVETAGPELTLSPRYLAPAGAGIELVVELTAGVAWLPNAPALSDSERPLQPFALATIGAGF